MIKVIKFNQSPIFSTRSYTQCIKLYRLKGSMRRSTHHNSSPIFLLSSPSKVATFSPIEEAIDALTMDVLIDANTCSSFRGSSCSWSVSSSLASCSSRSWTLTFFRIFPREWPFLFGTWILLLKAFLFFFSPCDIANFLFVHLWWAWVVQHLG